MILYNNAESVEFTFDYDSNILKLWKIITYMSKYYIKKMHEKLELKLGSWSLITLPHILGL